MATIRSYNSPKASPHLSAHTHVLASSPLSSSIKSTLPLPKAIRENRSFANLARLLGLAHGDDSRDHEQGDDSLGLDDEYDGEMEEEEDADGEGSEVVDEESLMWDAQVCHDSVITCRMAPRNSKLTHNIDSPYRAPTSYRDKILHNGSSPSSSIRTSLSRSRKSPCTRFIPSSARKSFYFSTVTRQTRFARFTFE